MNNETVTQHVHIFTVLPTAHNLLSPKLSANIEGLEIRAEWPEGCPRIGRFGLLMQGDKSALYQLDDDNETVAMFPLQFS